MLFAAAVATLPLLLVPLARAQEPTSLVRGWFAAVVERNQSRALALTEGSAAQRTADMLDKLKNQEAEHNAEVELKLQKLDVEAGANDTVKVEFAIDVIGRKWMFKKVARKLTGRAEFTLAESGEHIARIDGNLE